PSAPVPILGWSCMDKPIWALDHAGIRVLYRGRSPERSHSAINVGSDAQRPPAVRTMPAAGFRGLLTTTCRSPEAAPGGGAKRRAGPRACADVTPSIPQSLGF